MRDALKALAQLWKIDESARDYDEELRSLPLKVEAMRADVALLESLLSTERAQVEEASALRNERVQDLHERREALARAKSKVARARTLKEADAVEREIEATRRTINDREKEIAQLGATVDAKQESLSERERQLDEAKSMATSEAAAVEARLAEVRVARDQVVVGRDELVAKLPRRLVKRYEKLRGRDRHLPVAVVTEPLCVSCRMALPAQLFIEAQRAESKGDGPLDVDDFITCPHCHAFVVHADHVL